MGDLATGTAGLPQPNAVGRSDAQPDARPVLAHRGDIDGLRAVAILPVVLLHCGVSQLRGGFVGVDIFFVISGYLITAILWRELAGGRFSLAGFYRRRVLRIVPALAVMMAVVMAVGIFRLWPSQLRALGWAAVATAGFSANFRFWWTTDYFAQAADLQPLVHCWSLAVEEQFYLIYPFVLFALRRGGEARARAWLGGIAAMSLIGGAAMAAWAPAAGFYLLPARAWELLGGAVVALGGFPRGGAPRARSAVGLGALALIGASCLAINPGWAFPVPFALPPVIGAIVLLGLGPDNVAARLLALPPLRAIGIVSFSLYLWHRPIIAFYLLDHGLIGDTGAKLGLIAASAVAAGVSWVAIERPIRRLGQRVSGRRDGMVIAVGVGVLALLGVAGALIASQADRLRPLPRDVRAMTAWLDYPGTPANTRQFGGDCFVLPTGPDFAPTCLRAVAGGVLLMGDSHAAQYAQALRDRNGARLSQATAAGCRPLWWGSARPHGLARCRRVMDRGFALVASGGVRQVILGGRWQADELAPLAATILWLRGQGAMVTVTGPVVEYDLDQPSLLAKALLGGARLSGARFDHDDPAIARHRLADRAGLDGAVAAVARTAGARFVSEQAFECPASRCRLVADDGSPLHFDLSHLTPAAARGFVATWPADIASDPARKPG